MDLYLRIADELYLKRLIVGGWNGSTRSRKISGTRAWIAPTVLNSRCSSSYQAFADYESTMQTTQALFLHVVETVRRGEPIVWEGKPIDFTLPWRRLTIAKAAMEGLGVFGASA